MAAESIDPSAGYAIASVAFGDPIRTSDCLVKLTSDGGAMLKQLGPRQLPDHFLLLALSVNIRKPCEVIERAESFLRIRFLRC